MQKGKYLVLSIMFFCIFLILTSCDSTTTEVSITDELQSSTFFTVDLPVSSTSAPSQASIYSAVGKRYDTEAMQAFFLKGKIEKTTKLSSDSTTITTETIDKTDLGEELRVTNGSDSSVRYYYDTDGAYYQYSPSRYGNALSFASDKELSFMSKNDALEEISKLMEVIEIYDYSVDYFYSVPEVSIYFFHCLSQIDSIPIWPYDCFIGSSDAIGATYIEGAIGEEGLLYFNSQTSYQILTTETGPANILSRDEALEKFREMYDNLILTAPVNMIELDLNYIPQRISLERFEYTLTPAWCARFLNTRYDTKSDGTVLEHTYYSRVYINASTGDMIGKE